MVLVLSQLRHDHANFARLLNATERETDLICNGGQPNLELLKDIVAYFRGYLDKHHHAKENLIYGLLMQHMPAFGSNRLPVLEDHLHLAEGTTRFERALLGANLTNLLAREMLCQEARGFINHEREHMQAEEDVIFPAAERWLKAEHWAEVERDATDKRNTELQTLNSSLDRLLKTIRTTELSD